MQEGKTYKTKTGKTVEVVKHYEKHNAWLCLHDGYTACWYDDDGISQAWGSQEKPDEHNIQFEEEQQHDVLVPDCLRDDSWIAVDKSGAVWLYSGKPHRNLKYWTTGDGKAVPLEDRSRSLVLPKVPWDKACWQVEKLREMQWIPHTSHECPVDGDTLVEVRLKFDSSFQSRVNAEPRIAKNLRWDNTTPSEYDITHYRVVR